MALNQRQTYAAEHDTQATKSRSLSQAKALVLSVQAQLAPHLKSCEIYEPDQAHRIAGAPAVNIGGQLMIAPDLRCVTHDGQVFWVEVKDKSQRMAHPDTGADLHQCLGWYMLNRVLGQPVFLLFQDPADPREGLSANASAAQRADYTERWGRFGGKPYGAWIGDAIKPKSGYPFVSQDRSRNKPMSILYFAIDRMRPVEFEAMVAGAAGHTEVGELQAYHRIEFDEIAGMSIGGVPTVLPEPQQAGVCCECGKEITERVEAYSIEKHGRRLCWGCQRKVV